MSMVSSARSGRSCSFACFRAVGTLTITSPRSATGPELATREKSPSLIAKARTSVDLSLPRYILFN